MNPVASNTMGGLDFLLPAFVLEMAQGKMTAGEKELAYNLTVIYGLSILSMVILYKLFYPSTRATASSGLPSLASTVELIKTRRTVTPKDMNGLVLTRAEVETVLEAANWAP